MTDPKYYALFGNSIGQSNLPVDEPERDRIRQELSGIKKRQYGNFHKNYLVSKASLKFLEQTEGALKFAIACPTECNDGKIFDAPRKAKELAEKLEESAFELA